MGRLRYLLYAVLALVAAAGLAQGWLASGSAGTLDVSLQLIARSPETYQGRRVVTTGVVRRFQDVGAGYFVLEADGDPNRGRVLLEGDVPAALTGRRAEVTGTVAFAPERGVALQVEAIRALGP